MRPAGIGSGQRLGCALRRTSRTQKLIDHGIDLGS
jgi:hypothetical protein